MIVCREALPFNAPSDRELNSRWTLIEIYEGAVAFGGRDNAMNQYDKGMSSAFPRLI